ncbi:Nucleotidylyl transferase [Macrolepiota fuliginosa MF-IS2]|uniref:Nucleotidylyl transferase n=1 Tax=Macrolepiota fuliginosa MF-IS2 TaxID=1400762 RepID=A0A9P5XAZ3_9AGAR|nr:Nucleotidylyl transferase [Macrolepiota fuliginosa MF-IS2]
MSEYQQYSIREAFFCPENFSCIWLFLSTTDVSLFPDFPESLLVDNALLLATLPSLSTPQFLVPVITHATSTTRKRLVIVLFSRFFNTETPHSHLDQGYLASQAISHTDRWRAVQEILTYVYVQATKVAQDMGKVLMEIDVLLKGMNEDVDENLGVGMEIGFRVSGDAIPVPLPESVNLLRSSYIRAGERDPAAHSVITTEASTAGNVYNRPTTYPVSALGGTFDHLHAGHKILLSMAAWITSDKLIVGMTDDALLQNKANKHVMEDLTQRTRRVRQFLEFFKPGLLYDIVPINDVYGPTAWDPNIQALVVSKETLSGAAQIAKYRENKSFPALDVFVIDVISATSANLDHQDAMWLKSAKLSSTFIRQWIVDNEVQQ